MEPVSLFLGLAIVAVIVLGTLLLDARADVRDLREVVDALQAKREIECYHTYGLWSPVTSKGYQARKCDLCDLVDVRVVAAPEVAHNLTTHKQLPAWRRFL